MPTPLEYRAQDTTSPADIGALVTSWRLSLAAAAGAMAAGRKAMFATLMVSARSYAGAAWGADPLLASTSTDRFGTIKGPWLPISPSMARRLGWHEGSDGIGYWIGPDGATRVYSVLWLDGVIDAPPPRFDDEPGCGSYVVATTSAITEFEGLIGPLVGVEEVRRDVRAERNAETESAFAVWDWRMTGPR